jgi:predicted alpha-1,6-mannanase (GH76 family)
VKRLLVTVLAACGSSGQPAASVDAPDIASDDSPAADAAAMPGPDAAVWHGHADAALESLLLRTWLPGSAYLSADIPQTSTLTGYWTFAQALDAVLDGAERTKGAHFAGWIEAMYLAQDARGWSRNYYDDENWMALALIRAYDLQGDAKYLNEAKSLYANIEAAWDPAGGIWWDRAHTQKATASNAGPVITGVRLAARTGDASYLTFAKRAYAYWLAHMVDPTTHAVTDHVNPDGTLVHYKFTYNEGLVIGAAVALYGATNDPQYLTDAHAVAGYMLSAETKMTADGAVLFDGTNTHCGGDCQQFKGIGYRYLKTLYDLDPSHTEYAAVLDASAHAAWDLARGTGDVFAPDWSGPAMSPITIAAQSSAAMALSLYAGSLGAYTGAGTRYEAEDGVVHAIGLEATHAGFGGWSYLAGWHGDGQWVDFRVDVASAGTYHVGIRYAAGAGDASRLVYANGQNAVANFALPSTGSWDTWQTANVDVTLPAGKSTISIIYNSSLGSTNYANLDWLTVAP